MVSSILLQQSINCFIYNYQLGTKLKNPNLNEKCTGSRRFGGIRIKARAAIETVNSPTAFPFFQTESLQEDTPASKNPWDVLPFSGNSKIHLDPFLSVFNIFGSHEGYYHDAKFANDGDSFVDGAVLAAARTLPTWSERDMPPIPNLEMKTAKSLQEECQQILAEYTTTSKQDQHILDSTQEIFYHHRVFLSIWDCHNRNGYEKRNAQTLAKKMISLCLVPLLSFLQNPTQILKNRLSSSISNLVDNNIINEPNISNSKRKLLNMSMLIMFTAPFTSTCLASPQTQDQQQEGELLDLQRYTDIDQGFTLLRPASWIKVEKAGATLLFEDPIKGSNNVGVVVTPVRLNTLSEFGNPQFVSNKLIQAEKRKESTKDVEIVSFTERPGHNVQVYEFEYKLDSTRGGLKTIFSAAFVASKKLYLLNIAHSDNPQQPLSNQTRIMLQQVLHSFDVSTTNTQV